MTPKQKLITSEFCQVVIHESSYYDHTNSSDDGQGDVLDRAKEWALKKMIESKDKTDQRFVDLLRI